MELHYEESYIDRSSGYKTVDRAKIRLVDRYLTFVLFLYFLSEARSKNKKILKQRASIQNGIVVYSRLFLAVIATNIRSVNLWSRFSEIEVKQ